MSNSSAKLSVTSRLSGKLLTPAKRNNKTSDKTGFFMPIGDDFQAA